MSEPLTASASPERSILIDDDELPLSAAMSRLLALAGWTPSIAANGAEALRLLRSGYWPSAILLDQDMPVMNGSAFLEVLRATPELSGLPVMCMSGRDWPEAGARFLSKPFEVKELFAMLGEVVPREVSARLE